MEILLLYAVTIHIAVTFKPYTRIITQAMPPTPLLKEGPVCQKSFTKQNSNFSVYWNVPSQRCKYNYGIEVIVSRYGIISNSHDGWTGDRITIFPHPGHYPRVVNGSSIYGGIPQNTNLHHHVSQLLHDVNDKIPSRAFDGLAVVDYEAWQPLWSLNFDTRRIYQELSKELVKTLHPDWSTRKVMKEARREFEKSARKFLNVTMRTVMSSRPAGKWGFYHFPYCFNEDSCTAAAKIKCPEFAVQANNDLLWLFQSESALFPSAYLQSDVNSTCNRIFVNARLGEAKRVLKILSRKGYNIPAYLYSTFLYKENREFYRMVDLKNTIAKAFDAGLNGVVLWGNHNLSKDKQACHQLKDYVDGILGPFVYSLLHHESYQTP